MTTSLNQTEANRLTRLLQRVERAGGHLPDVAHAVFERLCAQYLRENKYEKKNRKR